MIYIHIPYCHRKCSYCAFYSVAGRSNMDSYVNALCNELRIRCHEVGAVTTVYFGGGTPSSIGVARLKTIVNCLKECYNLVTVEEVTLEANPEDLDLTFLTELRQLDFFDRLSIGVQSFNDRDLRTINRVHNADKALDALNEAHSAGFNNISVDLIMGLPGQLQAYWEDNLGQVGRLVEAGVVRHLSCYELTVEPGTILHRQLEQGRLRLPGEEVVAAEYESLLLWCQRYGMEQYEVSNFALPGWHSRHNSRYWERVPYLGAGAGAHSFCGLKRRWNKPDINAYILSDGNPPYDEETLTDKDAFNEYVMTSLRTAKGIDKKVLRDGFAWAYDLTDNAMRRFVRLGLVVETETAWQPTCRGLLQADGMASSLFFI